MPAVLAYYDHFIEPLSADIWLLYFLASGAIGILYKMNASISGAEVGCQGEVCVAAEIGMEHNLGLICDPVGGPGTGAVHRA